MAGGDGIVAGQISITGAEDLSGAGVMLLGPTTAGLATAQDGTFRFTGLPAGTYSVVATARSTAEVLTSRTTQLEEHASVTLDTIPFTGLGDVGGKVLLDGSVDASGTLVTVSGGSAAVTDAAGAFHLAGLVTGPTTLHLEHAGYRSADLALTVTYAATATAADATLTLAPPGTGTGTGSIRGMATLVGQTDHSGTTVTLSGPSSATTTTGKDGSYAFADIPLGEYLVSFENGAARENIPGVLALSTGSGYVFRENRLLPLQPIELARGRRLLSGSSIWYSVSPDGKSIAASVEADPAGRCNVVVAPLDGGPITTLSTTGLRGAPIFTPDGTRVVFAAYGSEPTSDAMEVANVDGSNLVEAVHDVYLVDGGNFVVDDTNLYFQRGFDLSHDLYSAPLDGSGPETKLASSTSGVWLHLVHGGKQIAYLHWDVGGSIVETLELQSLDGGDPVLLGTSGAYGVLPQVAPDDSAIVYHDGAGVSTYAFATAAVVQAPDPILIGFTGDSASVMQASDTTLALFPVGGGDLVQLATDFGTDASSSPDATKIVYLTSAGGLKLADITAGTSTSLADAAFSSTSWHTSAFSGAGDQLWYLEQGPYVGSYPNAVLTVAGSDGTDKVPLLSQAVDATWAGSQVVATRADANATYTFQNGIYVLTP